MLDFGKDPHLNSRVGLFLSPAGPWQVAAAAVGDCIARWWVRQPDAVSEP